MRIAVFGGTGRLGLRIAGEGLRRGHTVTVVSRNGTPTEGPEAAPRHLRADATDIGSVRRITAEHDVLVSVIKPEPTGASSTVVQAAQVFLKVLGETPGTRLIAVGGAGTLKDRDGRRLIDDPEFPELFKPYARAHADALDLYRADRTADWVCLSPADDLDPGERTGTYRLGKDHLVYDAEGNSRISMEDMAVAVLDEAEDRRHHRERFTVGY
ncbi:NAD(P)H-binding protein [Streptomyces sp. NBC_00726]|uniref:NAD(P)-dependent oxidoreductase n=1 Tax=Streptomyces sp. NBC_00726 TaxID=2903674 RepID=UPI00386B6084